MAGPQPGQSSVDVSVLIHHLRSIEKRVADIVVFRRDANTNIGADVIFS
jgi:hypothetical protein